MCLKWSLYELFFKVCFQKAPVFSAGGRHGTEGNFARQIEFSYHMEVRTLNAGRMFREKHVFPLQFERLSKKMILGEDPKHVSQLNVNLSLILNLCLSPILSLSPSPDLSLCVSLRRSWSWYWSWSWSWFSCSFIVCCSLSLSIWGHLGASGSI